MGELSGRSVPVIVSAMSEFSRGYPKLSAEEANDLKLSSFRFAFFDSWDRYANTADADLVIKTRWYICELERMVATYYREGFLGNKEGLAQWREMYRQRKFTRP